MSKNAHGSKRSKTAMAAAAMAIPLLGAPQEAPAQEPRQKPTVRPAEKSSVRGMKDMKWNSAVKIVGTVDLVGVDAGRIVYRNRSGELFYLEPETGDMKFLDKDAVIRVPVSNMKMKIEHGGVKVTDKHVTGLTITGVDANGNVLHRNAQDEVFYLDPGNGDMVFVK